MINQRAHLNKVTKASQAFDQRVEERAKKRGIPVTQARAELLFEEIKKRTDYPVLET